ncbi:MAG: shikimate dehydrogenase [Deltaproteobacteria bacterium]|nr:shikimate dehydrogenase [Deltaproteobacteria bacterium]
MRGSTRVFALVGHPVAHSLSPTIYNALFREEGIDAVYVALDVPPERGPAIASALRVLGLAGVNLTVPHKAAILPDLDDLDDGVVETGAANVVLCQGGRLHGYNTDSEGFCRAFEERFGPGLQGCRAMILGAGGAACAVAVGLARRSAASVVFLNRTASRARAAVTRIAPFHAEVHFEFDRLVPEVFSQRAPGVDLVVNATSGGARDLVDLLDVRALPTTATWCDLNYWMDAPPAFSACRDRGVRTQGGLDMLVHQAALAFELFTGRRVAPVRIRSDLG